MTRAARAVIDISALKHNLQVAVDANPSAKRYAVIKANGYGHGMLRTAQALEGANGYAVASLEEAQELRIAGVMHPILLLEGFSEISDIEQVRKHGLEVVVHHISQIELLEQVAVTLAADAAAAGSVKVWLKVDTGMHRLGFSVTDAEEAAQRLTDCVLVHDDICLMTHLANADNPKDSTTQKQLTIFSIALPDVGASRSIANSAGILGWPDSHSDIDRPGIMLYGVSPFLDEHGAERGLKPVMTLESKLIAVNHFKKGDAIGYGGAWKCPEDMPVGVVAIGYADGYPRHAPSGTPVLVNGKRVQLVGRVSMDMICVSLQSQPDAKVGDPVILWGEDLPAEYVAASANTIAYELFCNVSSRVPRVYVNG